MQKVRRVLNAVLAATVAALAVAGCGRLAGTSGSPTTTAPGTAFVSRVVDGDTVSVNIAGKKESVRLIGIDTPESVRPGGAWRQHSEQLVVDRCGPFDVTGEPVERGRLSRRRWLALGSLVGVRLAATSASSAAADIAPRPAACAAAASSSAERATSGPSVDNARCRARSSMSVTAIASLRCTSRRRQMGARS